MPILSPAGWLEVLDARLRYRQLDIDRYERYYRGDHKLTFATNQFREAFGTLFAEFASNWCALIVDAAVERLKVEGFRFGDSDEADQEAWTIWQDNGLDADSRLAHREAVKSGEAYALVDPNGGYPRITVEHPAEAIVAVDPANRRRRVAGYKRWVEDDGYVYATLYLPDKIYKFRSQDKNRSYGSGKVNWQDRPGDPGGVNPLGAVPLIQLCNNPSMIWGGQSDLRPAMRINDAINKVISNAMVASEFAAYPQRTATGMEIPKDPITGLPLEEAILKASVSRVWASENPDTKFGQLDAADFNAPIKLVEMLVQHIAAQTRTPPHYLLGQSGAFPSGESLKATETGLVARVEDKQVTFGEAWEQTLRLAFKAMGDDTRAGAMDAETIWRDPESRTEGEHIDAVLKLQALGIPQEALWERAGFTPQQIQRFKSMKAKETRRMARAMRDTGQSSNGTAPNGAGGVVQIVPADGRSDGVAPAGG